MIVLSLLGVGPDAVAADYSLSADALAVRYAARGEEDQGPILRAFLAQQGTTAEAIIVELLSTLDIEAHLRRAGLTEQPVLALRYRGVTAGPRGPRAPA